MMSINPLRSPWHAGELAIQQHAGVAGRMDEVGRRNVRDYMPDQHRTFFAQLPFVVMGAVDAAGDAWATLGAGQPGFIQSPDPRTLQIALTLDPADPAYGGLAEGKALGLLGIELPTRRRNRMNGRVARATPGQLEVAVRQSFGNCPKYIQPRSMQFTRAVHIHGQAKPLESITLDARARGLIRHASTFFVASYADLGDVGNEDGEGGVGVGVGGDGRQVDVSHRGGEPGFVRVNDDGSLTIPDFAGNLFFNTLGNLLLNGRAGLVFVDFATGGLLQMTGDAEVLLDGANGDGAPEGENNIDAFPGAERLWRFVPRRVIFRADALPMRWDGANETANNQASHRETASKAALAPSATSWKSLKIISIADESAVVRSFHLGPVEKAHVPGQHLPIRVTIDGKQLIRSYTLSSGPSDKWYRISVKRDGVVSAFLHDTLKVGDLLDARMPSGAFTMDAHARRPAVLLAAGIGVTPMMAMLRHIVSEGARTGYIRPSWLFYSARSKDERAFDAELSSLMKAGNGHVHVVRSLSDVKGAVAAVDYEAVGRIDMALLRSTLPFDDYDFYMCGPGGFMQAIYDGLRGLNVGDARIHAESFGPSGLRREQASPEGVNPPTTENAAISALPSEVAVTVRFGASGKEATWLPEDGALLPFAEAQGLTPEFGCRGGSCGLCRTRIVAGAVAYPVPPSVDVEAGEALICCAVPARGSQGLVLDI